MSSSAEFIAAHARHRPLELIFQRGTLESIPLLTLDEAEQQCRLRHAQYYPAYTRPTGGGGDWSGHVLLDSCDGLLLFQRDSDRKDFVVCNPVTQQWSMVPRVPGAAYTVPTGFYVHGPSGEHRLLCLTADDQGGSYYVCTLEAAAQAPRRLGQAWPWPLGNLYADLPVRYVNLGGKLHWLQHPKIRFSADGWPPSAEGRRPTILAFDSVLETFRRIRRPPWELRGTAASCWRWTGCWPWGIFTSCVS
ncbi:unnamed protein product [Miscanthus lutarioriparius]|uniref:Uncharacterized protein n=1 Tax=Miscanthus lutarioriparius TaxID=422564 RepID=A0A811PG53_9POAL|nr:unnamed protein product [Miscanthus lutarioriparius]